MDPVGERILAVLDDGLAGLVSVISRSALTGSHGRIVHKLQQVLAVAGDDGRLLAVLTEGIELVLEGGLNLLTGNVGQLGFSDQRFSLGTDKLLLENDNARGVGVLVLQLGDLIGDLLLAYKE